MWHEPARLLQYQPGLLNQHRVQPVMRKRWSRRMFVRTRATSGPASRVNTRGPCLRVSDPRSPAPAPAALGCFLISSTIETGFAATTAERTSHENPTQETMNAVPLCRMARLYLRPCACAQGTQMA